MKISSYVMRQAFAREDWEFAIQCLCEHHRIPLSHNLAYFVCKDRDHRNEIQVYYNGQSYEWHEDAGFRVLGYITGLVPDHDMIIFSRPAA